MYRWKMTDQIAADLARIEELRERLDGGSMPRRWEGRLRRELSAAATTASVTLEGIRVTIEQVIEIIAGTNPERVPAAEIELVRGYHDAMRYVLARSDDPNFSWTAELVRTVHYHVLGATVARGAGRYRDREVAVMDAGSLATRYEPPVSEALPRLLDDLADWLNDHADTPAPVLAALVHVRIAGVHPFRDGNGRTARVLATLAMCRAGYTRPEFTSLEEWWGRHHATYYGAFSCLGGRWNDGADVTEFVQTHVAAQRRQAEELSRRERALGQLWRALEDLVRDDLDRPVRLASALYDALAGREVRTSVYASLEEVTLATANSDLRALAEMGLLVRTGAGRSVRYLGTPELVARVAAELGIPEPDSTGGVAHAYDQMLASIGKRR